MKHRIQREKATTVSVDATIRDSINQEADHLGLSQRQMVTRLYEIYKLESQKEADHQDEDSDLIRQIYDSLEKILKRDDRIIAFIKEQEKVLLNPILSTAQTTDARLEQLIEILTNLE